MTEFEEWRSELLLVGKIIQDSDNSVSDEEAERRFDRYIKMLEALNGSEGINYAQTIFESIQVEYDYGAYQTAQRTIWRFGEKIYCETLLNELPRLIRELPDWAGDFLVSIANGQGTSDESVIHTFNRLLAKSSRRDFEIITKFIKEQEKDGWFEHRVGVLGGCYAISD